MRWGTALAAATVVAILGLFGSGLMMHAFAVRSGVPDPLLYAETTVYLLAVTVASGVGFMVVWRQPSHGVGWSLLGFAAAGALNEFALGYAELGILVHPGPLPGANAALVFDNVGWVPIYGALTAVALVFPNGRLPSRRWRPAAAVAGLANLTAGTATALFPRAGQPPFDHVRNPIGVDLLMGPLLPLFVLALVSLLAAMSVGAAAVVVRFRRSRGVERQQLKWLAFVGACLPFVLVDCWISEAFLGGLGLAFGVAFSFVLIGIPSAVGIAMFRHGLYDVDRLINRTLVYGTLTVLLAAAYAASALLLGVLLGRGSAWATAGATLAVALAFRPLRGWVQQAVDWRFDRTKYEAQRSIERFLDEVRRGDASPELVADVLRKALRDPQLDLLFWLPESQVYVDSSGLRVVEPAPGEARALTPVERGDTRLGVLLHDPALLERRELLRSVLAAGGLAVEIARLRVEVRVQLAEVQASRERILAAGYEERRRVERDLHDGAQQRLVSLGLSLHLLQRGIDRSPSGLRAGLDEAVDELERAIFSLRELARGFRPAQLDVGLSAALRDLARRSPIPVELDLTGESLPRDIETAAYFVACEAVTNTIKHADASRLTVRTSRENGHFVVRVEDDGNGGARLIRGAGLAGLSDRVDAHGGRLRVDDRAGGGTVIEAELPCGS